MLDLPKIATPAPRGHRLRSLLSLLSLGLALVLLVGTFFLMSPPAGGSYPGAIPWRDGSLLKRVTDLMSLYGSVTTIRGVEIKDLAFHLTTTVALLLLAGRALVSALLPPDRRTAKGAWFLAQAFLGAWVLLSLASSRWSGEPDLSRGQAALYGLALAWAVALSWNLESRDVPRILRGYVIIAAVGAALCVWYFHERNPYHRPGFPIGNPSALAACTLPAILITGAVLFGTLWTSSRPGHALKWSRAVAAAAALLPLCWCFKLAGSRAAWVGLFVGVGGVLFLRAKRWIRLTIVTVLVVLGGVGVWHFSSTTQEFAMARGATIRFRLYAWRYAALLWSQQPVTGKGAGQYPRLASGLSTGDRMLDPAAFMGEMVEHAHNELFEIFAEIGLVGGVTFVGGFLATLAAASALLRTNLSPERRWLLMGLVAGVIALLADSMFGVGLRLPGVPAVFYTLLGALWAICRSISKLPAAEHAVTDTWLRNMVLRRYGLTAVSLAAALVAGWLALRNWTGVRHEYAATHAQDYQAGLANTQAAELHLLDPVRKLIASKHAVDWRFARAQAAYQQATAVIAQYEATRDEQPDDATAKAQVRAEFDTAVERCRTAGTAALKLNYRARNFGRTAAMVAQCAEMLTRLYQQAGDEERAATWRDRAEEAWTYQRLMRPFDIQTLLSLTRYPVPVGNYVELLRDALRNGFPPDQWYQALKAGEKAPNFEKTLTAIVQAVGPYDPQTDLDTLILSRAPEMYRLSAAWKSLQGNHDDAASDAAQAALFYRSMHPRFPELYSVALAEQAEYLFQARPDEPRRSIALLRQAIHALPVIQPQKYAAMVAPYRLRLVRFLIAAGEQTEAAEILQEVLEHQPDNLQAWMLKTALAMESADAEAVRATLREAEAAGVRGADLEVLRGFVQPKMPELFDTPEDE